MTSLRVLIVDDEEELVSVIAERLQLRGIEADGVLTGADAIRHIEEREFDVVLLDVKMPGLSGFEVLRRIKRIRPHLPIVLLTGHGAEEDAEEGMRLGAFDYVLKPVDIEALIRILEDAMNQPGVET